MCIERQTETERRTHRERENQREREREREREIENQRERERERERIRERERERERKRESKSADMASMCIECASTARAEWDAPKEYNPEPDGEELELLRKMGWTEDQ